MTPLIVRGVPPQRSPITDEPCGRRETSGFRLMRPNRGLGHPPTLTLRRSVEQMDDLRPEYLDAVEAARWNGWLIPLFVAAPITIAICFVKRLHPGWLVGAALAAMFATWVSLILYSEHIWETMGAHAVTDAEWDQVTADTGRLFGPILVGIPFSVVYTLVWLLVIATGNWVVRAVGRAGSRRSIPRAAERVQRK